MELDKAQADTIITHLDSLNRQIAKQNSFARMFVVGVCYGVGFVVGSVIVASILIGLLAPIVGQIPWVQSLFEAGARLINH